MVLSPAGLTQPHCFNCAIAAGVAGRRTLMVSKMPIAASLDPETLKPMEAEVTEELPAGRGWQFEPKYDGFRCLAFRRGSTVDLRSRNQRPLARYFPDLAQALA